jgi:hypothetical protein
LNVLPGDDADLENLFTAQEYLDVALNDETRVAQTSTDEYAIFEFKDKNDNNTDPIQVTWEGQSDLAPSSSSVVLQIYNRIGATWVDVDTESLAGANTDFELTATISTDLGNYYDVDNWVAFRVYQNAV